MHWEKKICIRLTMRRIVGTVLAASTLVNLIIVGAVYGAESAPTAPPVTLELTTPLSTAVVFTPTPTPEEMVTLAPTQMSSSTPTAVPSIAPTGTFTPTATATDLPTSIACIKKFYWPTYRVQPGDWLSSIAAATGSNVLELRAANCLPDDRIYAGQLLYVPRFINTPTIPPSTFTPTPTDTPTLPFTPTSTDTPSITPTDTPPPRPTDPPTESPTETPAYEPTQEPAYTQFPTSTYTPTEGYGPLYIAQP